MCYGCVWRIGSLPGVTWNGYPVLCGQGGCSVAVVCCQMLECECMGWPDVCTCMTFSFKIYDRPNFISDSHCWYRHPKIMANLSWPTSCLVTLNPLSPRDHDHGLRNSVHWSRWTMIEFTHYLPASMYTAIHSTQSILSLSECRKGDSHLPPM